MESAESGELQWAKVGLSLGHMSTLAVLVPGCHQVPLYSLDKGPFLGWMQTVPEAWC